MVDSPHEKVAHAVSSDDVVVFMKGTREAPSCGFSAQMVEVLNHLLPNYSTYDVRDNQALRQAVKDHSGWPTFPQLYIRGEFIGGCDIVKELFVNGELAKRLGAAGAELPNPELQVSRAALQALEQLSRGGPIRLELDARGEAHLSVSTRQPSDIELVVNDVRFVLDVLTASRADGLRVDYILQPSGFIVTRAVVKAVSAAEVERKLRSEHERPLMVDCRTLAEFQRGSLPGAEHLNHDLLRRLNELPQEGVVVFFCRNGKRAHNVAEHLAAMRAEPAFYMEGGLEAWSARSTQCGDGSGRARRTAALSDDSPCSCVAPAVDVVTSSEAAEARLRSQ